MGAVNNKSDGNSKPVPDHKIPCCTDCTYFRPSIENDTKIKMKERFQQWSDVLQAPGHGINGSIKPRCSVVPNRNPRKSALSESADYLCQGTASSPRRFSLTFAGNIPEDWTEEQHSQLQSAIAAVARRSRLRFPGHREMQAEVSALALRTRESSLVYGNRCFLLRPSTAIIARTICDMRPLI